MTEVQIARMERDIVHIKESQAKQDEKLDKIVEKFEHFETHLETRFASKYVEKAFWWFLTTVGSILIGAIMYLVINVP